MYKTSKNFKIFAEASSYVPVVAFDKNGQKNQVVFENFLINNHCQFFNMTTCNIKLPVLESEHSFRIAFNHGGALYRYNVRNVYLDSFNLNSQMHSIETARWKLIANLKRRTKDVNYKSEEEEVFEKFSMLKYVPVVIKHYGYEFEIGVRERYFVNTNSQIFNKVTGRLMTTQGDWNDEVKLTAVGHTRKTGLFIHRICLSSFYPDKIPSADHSVLRRWHVDHINNDHSDMRLENLQWLKDEDHARKTMRVTQGNRKGKNEKKHVMIQHVKSGGDVNLKGRIFDSMNDVITFFGKDDIRSSASYYASGRGWFNEYYKLRYLCDHEILLEDEEIVKFGDYYVSNKGRVKDISGVWKYGTPVRGRYRTFRAKLPGQERKTYKMHRFVWMAFNGPIPDGLEVLHDDTNDDTRDDEGRERNWLCDLSLGTRSMNMQSYHDNKRRKIEI